MASGSRRSDGTSISSLPRESFRVSGNPAQQPKDVANSNGEVSGVESEQVTE
jgi:hypothetical protein